MHEANDDAALMQRYGISYEQRVTYSYKHYHYDKLEDAINFAKLEHERADSKHKSKQELNTSLKQGRNGE